MTIRENLEALEQEIAEAAPKAAGAERISHWSP